MAVSEAVEKYFHIYTFFSRFFFACVKYVLIKSKVLYIFSPLRPFFALIAPKAGQNQNGKQTNI